MNGLQSSNLNGRLTLGEESIFIWPRDFRKFCISTWVANLVIMVEQQDLIALLYR